MFIGGRLTAERVQAPWFAVHPDAGEPWKMGAHHHQNVPRTRRPAEGGSLGEAPGTHAQREDRRRPLIAYRR
jgi:hypothetical protein